MGRPTLALCSQGRSIGAFGFEAKMKPSSIELLGTKGQTVTGVPLV